MSIVGHVKRFWRFHSLIIGAFGLCALTLGCAVQESAYYEGTWVVTKAYSVGVSAHSSSASEQFLGRSMTYSPELAKLDQAVCESPIYLTKSISNDDFYSAFKATPSSLGFSEDSITEVSLSCVDGLANIGSTLVFQENSNTYTMVDGTFLKLEKTL
ncbi:hypothetical protein [Alteromonas gracilis]|uniref:hypothetical protein n=1 Tax=Alteromonas gracilis TaxID=1479524 RepID=UPI003736D632